MIVITDALLWFAALPGTLPYRNVRPHAHRLSPLAHAPVALQAANPGAVSALRPLNSCPCRRRASLNGSHTAGWTNTVTLFRKIILRAMIIAPILS